MIMVGWMYGESSSDRQTDVNATFACVYRKSPFYLVPMPGEVNDPTHWVNV